MADIEVELPDGTIIEVPEEMSRAEILTRLASSTKDPEMAQKAQGWLQQYEPQGVPAPAPAAAPAAPGQDPLMNPADETIAALGSGTVAPIAGGLAGIAGSVLPGPEGQGVEWLNKTKDALTYQPNSAQAQQNLQDIGEAVAPIAEPFQAAEEYLGEKGYQAGGPVGGAVGQAIPTAILELLTFGGATARPLLRAGRGDAAAPDIPTTDDALRMTGNQRAINAPGGEPGQPGMPVPTAGAPDSPEAPRLPPPTRVDPDSSKVKQAAQGAADDVDVRPTLAPLITPEGEITPAGKERIAEAVATGKIKEKDAAVVLTPQELERAAVFKRQEVTPLRPNITQRTTDFRNMQDAKKRSGPVAEAIAGQDLELAAATERTLEGIGPQSQDKVATNASAWQTVDQIVRDMDEAINDAYTVARMRTDDAAVVQPMTFVEKLKRSKGRENVSGGIPSAVKGELKNRDIINPDGSINKDKRLSVKEAEEVRQFLNSLYNPMQPQGNKLIREFKDVLDRAVAKVVPEDVFAPARAAKTEYHNITQRAARDKRDTAKGSFLEDVISNKIPEEKIVDRLRVARDDDVKKFKNFLLKDAPQPQGRQTWDDIRGQYLREALEAATGTAGKGEGGVQVFNSNKFRNYFKGMRNSKKWNTFFDAAERASIDDIIEIGTLRIPQGPVFSGSGPSGFAAGKIADFLARRVPGGDTALDLVTAATQRAQQKKMDAEILDPLTGGEQVLTAP